MQAARGDAVVTRGEIRVATPRGTVARVLPADSEAAAGARPRAKPRCPDLIRGPTEGEESLYARRRIGALVHPWFMRSEGEVVPVSSRRVGVHISFDTFFEEEHERVARALFFVTGNADDAEELMQDAFLKLWERWDRIDRIDDPAAYLFRVAFNGFRMRRRRAAIAVRRVLPLPEAHDEFLDVDVRTDVRQLLLRISPRQRAALLLIDLLGYPSEQAARIMGVRPSTVRTLATNGRRALRAEGLPDA